MTPNRYEAFELANLGTDDLRESPGTFMEVSSALISRLECSSLVVTRGKDGMSLVSSKEVVHLPTYAREVYDVTGAGDTVIAALSLGMASGLDLEASCVLGQLRCGSGCGPSGLCILFPPRVSQVYTQAKT